MRLEFWTPYGDQYAPPQASPGLNHSTLLNSLKALVKIGQLDSEFIGIQKLLVGHIWLFVGLVPLRVSRQFTRMNAVVS